MDNLNYHGYILEIHHGDSFKEEGGEHLYSGGEIMHWDMDPDKVSVTHMVKELKNMGYKDLITKESEETGSSGSESDFAYGDVAADLSEEDDSELEDIKSQVQIAKKKRAEKLKSLRLQKDLETIIREARQDKRDNKGKEKEGSIIAVDAGDEGYITDFHLLMRLAALNLVNQVQNLGMMKTE
ncbi:hypothetical protein CRG98_018421 [Punica granatum]|uniref:PB1-like domain-containing protein n=1 Tax=Punica granatum TaxID=22663 RepID=A0A2I0JZC2_PUNGR|nr:hypothetical protein CRG98_018421 [Punica granatum]